MATENSTLVEFIHFNSSNITFDIVYSFKQYMNRGFICRHSIIILLDGISFLGHALGYCDLFFDYVCMFFNWIYTHDEGVGSHQSGRNDCSNIVRMMH